MLKQKYYRFQNIIDRPYVWAIIFVIVGISVIWNYSRIHDYAMNLDTIMKINTIFVIANSLFSLIFPLTMKRESLFGRRHDLVWSLFAIWLSVFLVLFEIIRGEPHTVYFTDIPNIFTKLAIVSWGFGIFQLLRFSYRVITLDKIHFNRSNTIFEHNQPKNWGLKLFDEKLHGEDKTIWYPIYILGNEETRPWEILQRFLLSGMSFEPKPGYENGAIYFTFTRPTKEIVDMLDTLYTKKLLDESKDNDDKNKNDNEKIIGTHRIKWENIVIIDCYSIENEKNVWNTNIKHKEVKNFSADPKNPHDINKQYEKALKHLEKNNCKHIRVVYDAISDFLKFTDFELAAQYLRHNMGYEQRHNVDSLYLFRSGTMPKEQEQYFQWFANGLAKLTRFEQKNDSCLIEVDFRGPFKEPKKFLMDYDYKEAKKENHSLDVSQT